MIEDINFIERRKHLTIGWQVGAWTIIGSVVKKRYLYWPCKCACGTVKLINEEDLKARKSLRCFGCRTGYKVSVMERRIVENYRLNAKKKGRVFTLSRGDCIDLMHSPCFYCGEPPGNPGCRKMHNRPNFRYTGIDRKDSSLGYTKDNVVAACFECNMAKRSLPFEDFLNLVRRQFAHLKEKGLI